MKSFFSTKLFPAIGLAVTIVAVSGCQKIAERFDRNPSETNTSESNLQRASPTALANSLPFGNPSGATTDPANKDNYLVIHDSYLLSYSNSRGTLNWIAWRTTRSDLGEHLPRHLFDPDPTLPAGFKRIQYYDYSGSGYDRGHMVPSADRFGNKQRNEETFLMTNIVPQTGDLNQFTWNKLEMYARSLVYKGSETYTIAGVYGENGRLRDRVTVPTNCWKVIVVFSRGRTTIEKGPRIIAVDMPNIDGIEDDPWEKYRTTVRAIEKKTGYDLFSALPGELQDRLETVVDNGRSAAY